MTKRADFKLTKDWGVHKKGKVFPNMDRARARSLQDVHKVGKIVEPKQEADPKAEVSKLQKENEMLKKENDALKAKAVTPKAVKPEADKAEPKAKARVTK